MDKPWFRPKRFGYGAGLPLNWKGWLLTGAYVGLMLMLSLGARAVIPRYLPDANPRIVLMLAVAAITIPFALVVRAKTQGGWSWHWGKKD